MSAFSIGTAVIDFLGSDGPLQKTARDVEVTMIRLQWRVNQIGAAAQNILSRGSEFLGMAFREASKFEEQMARVQTVMGTNTTFASKFRTQIQAMAVEFGESTDELSHALYDIISAGIDPAKALDVLRESARLTVAGFADLRDTSRGLTSIMTAFQIPANQAAQAADQIFQAVNVGRLELEDLVKVLGYVGPYAFQAGLSLDQMLSALSTMTQTTGSAQQAAVQLSGFMRGFVRPSKQSAAAAAQFGITLGHTALQGDNLMKTLRQLEELGRRSPEAVAKIFPDIRGTRGALALTVGIEEMIRSLQALGSSSGAVQHAYDVMSNTPERQMKRFHEALLAVWRTIGQVVTPVIRQYADLIQGNLGAIQTWILVHQQGIRTALEFSAAILATAVVLPRVLTVIRTLAFSVQALAATFSFTGRAIMFAFANPLWAGAIVAVAAFAAVAGRSIATNETWAQSAYHMARAVGIFRGAIQELADAQSRMGESSQEVARLTGELSGAEKQNAPIIERIALIQQLIDAQSRYIDAALDARREAAKTGGQEMYPGGPKTKTGDAGITDKFLKDQQDKLDALKAKLKALQGEQQKALSPDFSRFARDIEDDIAVNVDLKPKFRGLADLADQIQLDVFNSDPAKQHVDAINKNTAAVNGMTQAAQQLAQNPLPWVVAPRIVGP